MNPRKTLRTTAILIQVLIALILFALVSAQAVVAMNQLIPGSSAEDDGRNSLLAIAVIVLLACVEVGLVCVWRLVSLVGSDRIFDGSAKRWVRAISASIWTAVALLAAIVIPLYWQSGVPLVAPLAGTLLVIFGIGLGLVVQVMRDLLRQATAQRSELEEVV